MKLEEISTNTNRVKVDRGSGDYTISTESSGEIYSQRLGKYVPLDSSSEGEIQRLNVGLAPGSWY